MEMYLGVWRYDDMPYTFNTLEKLIFWTWKGWALASEEGISFQLWRSWVPSHQLRGPASWFRWLMVNSQWKFFPQTKMKPNRKIRLEDQHKSTHTVDRNKSPVDMVNITFFQGFNGFYTSQVVSRISEPSLVGAGFWPMRKWKTFPEFWCENVKKKQIKKPPFYKPEV